MSHCVFMHRADSVYDDSPAERYQFPKLYLGRASVCVGSWIVYLEPTKIRDSRGYFAVARVERIIPDPSDLDMYLALIEPGSYLDFSRPVAFNISGQPVESGLLNERGRLSGRAQAAVRPISVPDFERIVALGLQDGPGPLPRDPVDDSSFGFREDQTPFEFSGQHDRLRQMTTRALRDRVFRTVVLRAYEERCAMTGLKLINGGGRAEVQAAHIQPVEAGGPDIVTNGLALSGTAHWMFDRGLFGLTDDLEIIVSRHVNDPASVRAFINPTGRALTPQRLAYRPHHAYLKWHRDNRLKL